MKNETILITGSAGFIGTHLVRKLVNLNFTIVCFDIFFSDSFISEFNSKVIIQKGNLNDKSILKKINQKYSFSFIFHLAGSKSRTNNIIEFKESFEINYFGTLNLLDTLINNKNLKKIILMGTMDEYGDSNQIFDESSLESPLSAYGLSKLTTTKLGLIYHKEFDLPITVIRPSIVYGHNQGVEMFIPSIINTLSNDNFFDMTSGEQERDFLYICDLIEVIIKVKDSSNTNGEVINIGYGKSIKLVELAKYISNKLKKDNLLNIGSVPYRSSESMNYSVCINKAKRLLKWKPKYDIYSGIDYILGKINK